MMSQINQVAESGYSNTKILDIPMSTEMQDSQEVLDVCLGQNKYRICLTPEMVRDLILRGEITPDAKVSTPGGVLRSIREFNELIPFGALADKAIKSYQSGGTKFGEMCRSYLGFAQNRKDIPGRAIIEILLYFLYREQNPSLGLKHLFEALAATSINEKSSDSFISHIQNDIGVMLLLHFNSPSQAVLFFESSISHGYGLNSAGIENLYLISAIAKKSKIALPGLEEIFERIGKFKSYAGLKIASTKDRPHPTEENWAWYLDERIINPSMLIQSDISAEERNRAVEIYEKALKTESKQERAILLSIAAETLVELEPLAKSEQKDIEILREAKKRQQRQEKFFEEAKAAEAELKKGDFDSAGDHILNIYAVAVTEPQKKAAEQLAEETAISRANRGQESYALINGSTFALTQKKLEESSLHECITNMDESIKTENFERALSCCQKLSNYKSISNQECDTHRKRVIASAQEAIRERLRKEIYVPNYDFEAGEECIKSAKKLLLDDQFCNELQTELNRCREQILSRQIRGEIIECKYVKALELIINSGSKISEEELKKLIVEAANAWKNEMETSRCGYLSSVGSGGNTGSTDCLKVPPIDEALQIIIKRIAVDLVRPHVETCFGIYHALEHSDWTEMAKGIKKLQSSHATDSIVRVLAKKCIAEAEAKKENSPSDEERYKKVLQILSFIRAEEQIENKIPIQTMKCSILGRLMQRKNKTAIN